MKLLIIKRDYFKKSKKLFLLFMFLITTNIYAESISEGINETAPELNKTLQRIEKNISGINTLKTAFIQEKKLAVFSRKIILKGMIFIEKPELFAWHVSEPMRYSLVINGNMLSQWDEDTDKIQNVSLSKNPALNVVFAQMKEWIAGTYSNLLKEYSIILLENKPIVLKFTPLEKSPSKNVINYVTVIFKEDEQYISQIEIDEKNGDATLIRFNNTHINEIIDSAAWDVKPHVR